MNLLRIGMAAMALALSNSALHGQVGLDAVQSEVKEDLDSALQRLSSSRDLIRKESVPLSQKINRYKASTRQLRAELKRARQARDTRSLGLEALEGQVKAIQDENDYLSGLLGQYFQELQAQMTAVEQQVHEDLLLATRDVLDSPESSPKDKYRSQIDIVKASIARLNARVGGVVYPGKAVAGNGEVQTGSFVEIGPISVFSNQAGSEGGIIEAHHVAVPNATPLSASFASTVSSLAASEKGDLSIDVTMGAALAIEGAKESVGEHVLKGGIWVWPIVGFAVLASLLAVYKLFAIYSIKQPNVAQLGVILRQVRDGKKEEAIEVAKKLPWEFGPMISAGVDNSGQGKELVEEVMYEKMLEAQPKVERFLSVIAVTAAVSPLLGLLGTVTGMINTFKMITLFGTGDASSLSGGISEALITTELGLVVAIPALVAHAMLNRKSQAILAHMEKLAVVFLNGLPRK